MADVTLLAQVDEIAAAARALAVAVDGRVVPPDAALRLYRTVDQAARSLAATKVLLSAQVEAGSRWRTEGHRSAAELLAKEAGTTVGAAKEELETAAALVDLPTTKQAMLDGSLSRDQGAAIAGAARHNPAAEGSLLHAAGRSSLRELRDEAARARAAGDADPAATEARIHRARRVTSGRDADGAFTLHGRGTLAEGSVVAAELARLTDQIFRANASVAAADGREQYGWDALVEMARRSSRADDGGAPGPRRQARPEHLALLRLDLSALWRGHVEGDELCEITGLGPIPLERARALLGDAVLKLVITDGVDVVHVTSLTRGPTQAMRYAALWTSPFCVVEGCANTICEYDHRTGTEYKDTHHTRLDELDRPCTHHHDLHTRSGWALVAGTGKRPMVPPDDPRHPLHPAQAARAGPAPPGDPLRGAPAPPARCLFDVPA